MEEENKKDEAKPSTVKEKPTAQQFWKKLFLRAHQAYTDQLISSYAHEETMKSATYSLPDDEREKFRGNINHFAARLREINESYMEDMKKIGEEVENATK